MKKKSSGIFTLVLLYILSIFIIVTSIDDLKFIITGEANDINDMIETGEELEKGNHVSIKLEYAIDWYAETNKRTRRSSNHSYHALGVLDDGRIVSIKVSVASKEYYKLDDLINETYDYLNGERTLPPTPVILTGGLLKLDPEVEQYFKLALNYMGYSQSDALYLEIDVNQKQIWSLLTFAFGVVVFVLGTMLIIVNKKEKNYKKIGAKSFVVQQSEDELNYFDNIPDTTINNADKETDGNEENSISDNENIYDTEKNKISSEGKFSLKND